MFRPAIQGLADGDARADKSRIGVRRGRPSTIVHNRTNYPAIPGDPAVILGRPSGVENFDNANNWSEFNSRCFTSRITGGQFVMTANGVPQFSCWEFSWPRLGNFYLETTQRMPRTRDPQDRFGVIFRAPIPIVATYTV